MKDSVRLLTHNEAEKGLMSRDALRWCDDIAIVDLGSTDSTLDIARQYNVRASNASILMILRRSEIWHSKSAGFTNEWVLHLDADEVPTLQFVARLEAFRPENSINAGYHTPCKIKGFSTAGSSMPACIPLTKSGSADLRAFGSRRSATDRGRTCRQNDRCFRRTLIPISPFKKASEAGSKSTSVTPRLKRVSWRWPGRPQVGRSANCSCVIRSGGGERQNLFRV